MRLDELLEIVSQKTENGVNQSQLADCFGITRQTVSNRIKTGSEVTVSELKKAENYFKIRFFDSDSDDNIANIDYYSDVFASCGKGSIVFSEEKSKLPIAKSLINGYSKNKKYSIITASGNSMHPTIENGDRLIVEHLESNFVDDNEIYVFCFNNEIFVKRLCKNLDEVIIKSDNPEYRTKTINSSTVNELKIIGKIIGVFKGL